MLCGLPQHVMRHRLSAFPVSLAHHITPLHPLQLLAAAVLQLDWPTINLSSAGIFSLSTFALSLLLVFRTNSSYERCVT